MSLCGPLNFMRTMKLHHYLAVGLLALAWNVSAQDVAPTGAPLTFGTSEVMKLVQAKVAEDTIVAFIRSSREQLLTDRRSNCLAASTRSVGSSDPGDAGTSQFAGGPGSRARGGTAAIATGGQFIGVSPHGRGGRAAGHVRWTRILTIITARLITIPPTDDYGYGWLVSVRGRVHRLGLAWWPWWMAAIGKWLSDMDSNHDKSLQRALCYRYTIGQTSGNLLRLRRGAQINSVGLGLSRGIQQMGLAVRILNWAGLR